MTFTNQQLLPVYKEAREILSDPSRWTKGALARNSDGVITRVGDDDACTFCTLGAIQRAAIKLEIVSGDIGFVYQHPSESLARPILEVRNAPSGLSHDDKIEFVTDFNDDKHTEHKDVLAMFDKVVERLSCPA
jgi:hypothetical protein